MRKLAWSLVCSLVVFGMTKMANAHEFICEKTVNGMSTVEVNSYPTTLNYEFKVINSHSSDTSIYTSASDPYLPGFTFDPAAPHAVPVGQMVTDTHQVVLQSAQDCQELAASDGTPDGMFMNTFTVTWDSGQASCSASVTCGETPPPPPPPEENITRTPGFFKTHVQALQQCVDEGAIDLGFLTITSIEEALGLLWGSPSMYSTGDKRSKLDKTRFILARHTLVATCNVRLFDAEPTPSTLLADAVAALAGNDCELMSDLSEQVDAFNNSGDDEAFPDGFVAGPATPQQALGMALDPTAPSGEQCL